MADTITVDEATGAFSGQLTSDEIFSIKHRHETLAGVLQSAIDTFVDPEVRYTAETISSDTKTNPYLPKNEILDVYRLKPGYDNKRRRNIKDERVRVAEERVNLGKQPQDADRDAKMAVANERLSAIDAELA